MLEWQAPQKKLMTLFYRKQIPDSESTDMSCTCGHVFKEIKLIGGKRFSGKTEILYDELSLQYSNSMSIGLWSTDRNMSTLILNASAFKSIVIHSVYYTICH